VLDDLRARLDRVRWPAAPTPGWEHGADVETIRELVRAWRDDFDWRRQEGLLDERLPGHRARVRGLELHFAWLKGRGPRPLPLLLLHGWPGSTFEMIEVAGPLADPAAHGGDPADAFDLVIPSLPGHGFSEAPSDPFFGADAAADVLRDLMVDVLGYARFGAQGGDRGAGALAAGGGRLLRDPVDAAADAGLRARGFARGPRRVDRREVARLERLRGRRPRPLYARGAADERHDLLGQRLHPLLPRALLGRSTPLACGIV
jgi:pimeloyl-ACP methyl ester carboxylesterase